MIVPRDRADQMLQPPGPQGRRAGRAAAAPPPPLPRTAAVRDRIRSTSRLWQDGQVTSPASSLDTMMRSKEVWQWLQQYS